MPILELSRIDAPAVRARALVFEAPASRALLGRIDQLAPTDATVLITGRNRHGQRDRRPASPRSKLAREGVVRRGQLRRAHPVADRERAIWPRAAGVHGRVCEQGRAGSRSREQGTLFLDEMGDLPLGRRSSSSACCKSARSFGSARGARPGSTFASSPRRTCTSNNLSRTGDSARTCTTGSMSRTWRSRRCATAAKTFCPSPGISSRMYSSRLGIPGAELTESDLPRLSRIGGRATFASSRTSMHHALLVAREDAVRRLTCASRRAEPRAVPRRPRRRRRRPTPAAAWRTARARTLERASRALRGGVGPACTTKSRRSSFARLTRSARQNQLRTARLLGISRNIVRARLHTLRLLARLRRASRPRRDGAGSRREGARCASGISRSARCRCSR